MHNDLIFKHLRATLVEMGYEYRDIHKIVSCLKNKIYNYESASTYKGTKTLPSFKIMEVTVPRKFYDMKVADLEYSTDKMAARITNALGRSVRVVVLGDFIGKSKSTRELVGIKNIGPGAREEFSRALKQAIGGK
jgi:hypothetical protein